MLWQRRKVSISDDFHLKKPEKARSKLNLKQAKGKSITLREEINEIENNREKKSMNPKLVLWGEKKSHTKSLASLSRKQKKGDTNYQLRNER